MINIEPTLVSDASGLKYKMNFERIAKIAKGLQKAKSQADFELIFQDTSYDEIHEAVSLISTLAQTHTQVIEFTKILWDFCLWDANKTQRN